MTSELIATELAGLTGDSMHDPAARSLPHPARLACRCALAGAHPLVLRWCTPPELPLVARLRLARGAAA